MYECGHVVEVAGDDMVGDVLGVGVVGEVVEEEEGQAGEELALVRDAVLHDHVKRRDAVGRDKEESVVVTGHGVDVAHLAPREQLQRRAVGLGQGSTRPARHGEVWEREQEGEEEKVDWLPFTRPTAPSTREMGRHARHNTQVLVTMHCPR